MEIVSFTQKKNGCTKHRECKNLGEKRETGVRKRNHERVGGRIVLEEELKILGFTPSLTKPEMVKEVEDGDPARELTGRNELG